MGLEQVASQAQASVGTVGENLGQKAVDLAAEKGPNGIQSSLNNLIRWFKRHPVTTVALIIVAKAMVGVLTGTAAKAAEAK